MNHNYEFYLRIIKAIIILTDCGKQSGKRGGTGAAHSTGDETTTDDVCCHKILFRGPYNSIPPVLCHVIYYHG